MKDNNQNDICDNKDLYKSITPKAWLRVLLIICGSVSMTLGFIGLFFPILPTTPFVLLAAACYARSSSRIYNWLINNRIFGGHLRQYREKRSIKRKIKIKAIILLWVSILVSLFFFVIYLWLKILLLVVASAVTLHIASIKTES